MRNDIISISAFLAGIILIIVLLLTGFCNASVVTCNLEGYIHSIELGDDVELDGSVDYGINFTATFVYDTDAPDLSWENPRHGKYNIISIDITVGN